MPKNREVLMDEEKRSNQNYEIIESCTIGSTELVIGHNPNAPNPYVCWYCKCCPKIAPLQECCGLSAP